MQLKVSNISMKRIITLFILVLFMVAFVWHKYRVILKRNYVNADSGLFANIFMMFAVLSIVFVLFMYIIIVKKCLKIHNAYLFSVIVLALGYMCIFLPNTVPDEPVHYFEAYKLSNYFTFHFEQSSGNSVMMRQSDVDWYKSCVSATQNAQHFYNNFKSFEPFSSNNSFVESGIHNSGIQTNVIFGYVFSALGITVARVFNFSPFITYYFGRLFNIVAYSLMSYWAIKRTPIGKMAIFSISTLPMSLHLIASYSYDPMILAFAIMFVAQVLYMREKEGYIAYKDLAILAFFGILISTSKLVYLPMVLLVFIIPKEKFNIGCMKISPFAVKTFIFVIAVLFLLIFQLSSFNGTISDPNVSWANEEARTISWLFEHPIEALKVYVDTLFIKGEFYFNTLIGSSLAWFQVNLPTYCFVPFFVILLFSFMMRDNEKTSISFYNKLWILFTAFASFALILTSMLLAWTPKSYPAIEGVQGRYFLPLLILLFLIIRNKFVTIRQSADKYIMFVVIYWNLFTGIELFCNSFI